MTSLNNLFVCSQHFCFIFLIDNGARHIVEAKTMLLMPPRNMNLEAKKKEWEKYVQERE